MFDDTTINGWLTRPGPIHLRRTERKPDTPHDLALATVLIYLALGVVDALLVGYAIYWLLPV